MVPRRYAGYRLAGLPLENVNAKVKEAGDVLKANRTPMPTYEEEVRIPGYDASVFMGADSSGGTTIENGRNRDYKNVRGNSAELQKLIDAKPPGIFTLGWGVNNKSELDDKGRFLAARTAQKEFKRIFADMPNGTIVKNAPVGGTRGDYTRADAYMTQGMGPLQEDGVQYAVMNNGQMEPISPFVSMTDHARHLADRAERGGQQDIAKFIRLELDKRHKQDNTIPKRIRKAGEKIQGKIKSKLNKKSRNQFNNDEYYDDYDDGEYDDPFRIKTESDRVNQRDDIIRAEISYPVRDSGPEVPYGARARIHSNPVHVPEIQLRDYNKQSIARDNRRWGTEGIERVNTNLEPGSISESLYRDAYPNVYIPTAQDINEIRSLQASLAMIPGGARRTLDNIEAVRPRAAPPTLTVGDDGTIYGDRPFGRARSVYTVPTLDSWDSDIVRPSPNFVPDYNQIRDIARADAGRGYTDAVHSRQSDYNFRDPTQIRESMQTNSFVPSNPELTNEIRQYQTILNSAQQRSPTRVSMDARRRSSNPDITSLTVPDPEPSAVDAIRDELGLRRRLSNGSLAPETDDVPF